MLAKVVEFDLINMSFPFLPVDFEQLVHTEKRNVKIMQILVILTFDHG